MINFTANAFKRLRPFAEMPSVTAQRHIKLAPFAGEPVGKFEESMPDCNQATLDAFYYGNMAGVMNLVPA